MHVYFKKILQIRCKCSELDISIINFEYLEIYTLLTNHTTRKNILESSLPSNMNSYLINDPMNSYFKNSDCSNVSKTL